MHAPSVSVIAIPHGSMVGIRCWNALIRSISARLCKFCSSTLSLGFSLAFAVAAADAFPLPFSLAFPFSLPFPFVSALALSLADRGGFGGDAAGAAPLSERTAFRFIMACPRTSTGRQHRWELDACANVATPRRRAERMPRAMGGAQRRGREGGG